MSQTYFYYICIMSRKRSYSVIYNVQRIILLVFFTTTAIALSIPLARLVTRLSPDNLFPLVATLLVYMALVIMIGSLIHVVSYIPFNLAAAFDPIKNDIASGKIADPDRLASRITAFTTEFFNFSFIDISHAFIQLEGTGLISHEPIDEMEESVEASGILERSRIMERLSRAGKIHFRDQEYHLYVLPFYFGDKWLGYMGLLTAKRLSRFFQRFLMEFEDDFLDDQIMIVTQIAGKNR